MKILMLTPYLPYPPASGGQIRTYNLLKYLSIKNEITLISLYKNENEKQYAKYLQKYCKNVYVCKRAEKPWQVKNVLRAVFSRTPFLMIRNFSSEARNIVEKLLKNEQFDVIHAETFYIMPHIPKTKIPILLVEQTIEYKVYQHWVNALPFFLRPFFNIEITKLKWSELSSWKTASLVASVSEYDQLTIKQLLPEVSPVIVPNGASDDMYVSSLKEKNLNKPVLLFIGNFSWLQNTEAAEYLIRKIFPLLKNELPNIKIIIAGQNALSKILEKSTDQIKIMGDAPLDDEVIKKLYIDSTLFIGPLFGPGGTNLKILNALAAGLPVIATKVATERLELENNKNVLVANTPEEFVESIKRILNNKNLYQTLRENAYQLAKDKYSYKAIAHQLEVMYRSIRNTHEDRR